MRTLLVSPPLVGGSLVIEGEEAHHGRAVLRLVPGDAIRIADGAGSAAKAQVVAVDKRAIRVACGAVESVSDGHARLLTIAVAPPKGDRLADLVRGLTELGVGTIQLLATERGERLPGNLDRLDRIAREALKQCRRGWLPQILPAIPLPDLVRGGAPLTVLDRLGRPAAPGRPVATTLVVGPEGGFSPEEFSALDAAGARQVRLASPILRIETAALAAAAVWAAAWEPV